MNPGGIVIPGGIVMPPGNVGVVPGTADGIRLPSDGAAIVTAVFTAGTESAAIVTCGSTTFSLGTVGLAIAVLIAGIVTSRPSSFGGAIVREAQKRKAEIVLMSTHGRSGFRRTMLGSVADHVLRHLDDIPILLVHPRAK